jgi:hypothetical protein
MAHTGAHQKQTYFVFYGNQDAELPEYPTDLVTTGEGFGLDIENQFYKASLSRQMGQLERLTLKREHGMELFSGAKDMASHPVLTGRMTMWRLEAFKSSESPYGTHARITK